MKQFIIKYVSHIEWLFTGLLFIVIPVIYSKVAADPVLYPRYLVLSIWLVLMSVTLLVQAYRNKFSLSFSSASKFIFVTVVLFILWNVISAFQANNAAEALFKTFKEAGFLMTFFYFYQVFKNNPESRDIAIKSAIIMAFIFLAIGVSQLIDADFTKFKAANSDYGYWFRQAIGHVKSTLANINPFASLVFLSLAFSTYGTVCYKKIWRIISIVVVALSLFFIFILASKAVWGALALVAVAAFVLLYVYLFVIMPREQDRKLPLWGKVGVLILPFFMVISGFYVIQKTEIKIAKVVLDKVQQVLSPELSLNTMYTLDNPSSAQTRTLVWANTIQMARDNPFFGVGPGQWRMNFAQYGLDGFEYDIRNGIKHFQRPHNDFIWILGEVGFVGLLLFLIIYIGILRIAFRNFYRNKNYESRIFSALAFVFLIGYMIILFVSFSRERTSHNLVYLLLFAVVLSFVEVYKGSKSSEIKNRSLRMLVFVLLGAVSVFNLRIAVDMVKGDQMAKALMFAAAKNNLPLMYRAARSLEGSYYTLDPFTTPIPYYTATVLHSKNETEAAKKEFLKAYEFYPYHLKVLSNLATSYDLTGDKKTAMEYYQKALDISPRFKEALVNMAIVNYNLNKFDEAFEYIVKVPYGESNPNQFKKVYMAVCKTKAARLANQCDIDKLKDWLNDENKVNATFVKVQREKASFDKILLQEIGK